MTGSPIFSHKYFQDYIMLIQLQNANIESTVFRMCIWKITQKMLTKPTFRFLSQLAIKIPVASHQDTVDFRLLRNAINQSAHVIWKHVHLKVD